MSEDDRVAYDIDRIRSHFPALREGAAHFDVPQARGEALIADLRRHLPGYLVPRLVRETPGAASKTVLA